MVGCRVEPVEADVEELDHGWPITMVGWATLLSQRHNMVAQKQRPNLRCFAFLSLLLLLSIAFSIASAEVSLEDRCDDRGECQNVTSDMWKIENRAGWLPVNFSSSGFQFLGFVGDQDFGRDTNRLDYFRVTALEVHGDDHLTGNASYDDGGGIRDHIHTVDVIDPRLGQEIGDAPTDADGSDMTPQVPVRIFYDNARDGSETIVQMLDQNSRSDGGEAVVQGLEHERDDSGGGVGDGGEAVVQGLEHERDDSGGGVGDGEDGGDLVIVGWWEKWLVWLGLWKIV